jgi:hypothetical protein
MKENKDEISQQIKDLATEAGYEIIIDDGKPREHEEILHMEVQLTEDDNLYFTVAIGSSYLRITYMNKKGIVNYKKFKDTDEMLDFIKESLRTKNKIA